MKQVIFGRAQSVRRGQKVRGEVDVFASTMHPNFAGDARRQALCGVLCDSASGHPSILIRRRPALQHFLQTDCLRRRTHAGFISHFREHWRDVDDSLVMSTLRRVTPALHACHAKINFARPGPGDSRNVVLSLCNVCKKPSSFLLYASVSYAVFRFADRMMAYPKRPFEAPSSPVLTAIAAGILLLAERHLFWRLDGSAS